jgi:hypothetical protein
MEHVALTLTGRYLRPGVHDERLRIGSATLRSDAVFERVELGHGRIALRVEDGRYLTVEPDPGLSHVVQPQPELTPAAAFEEILWPNGQVSLRTCHLTYVGVDTTGRVTADPTRAGIRERFFLVTVPVPKVPQQRRVAARAGQSSAPRATSASPSSSAWRSDRMMRGTA